MTRELNEEVKHDTNMKPEKTVEERVKRIIMEASELMTYSSIDDRNPEGYKQALDEATASIMKLFKVMSEDEIANVLEEVRSHSEDWNAATSLAIKQAKALLGHVPAKEEKDNDENRCFNCDIIIKDEVPWIRLCDNCFNKIVEQAK